MASARSRKILDLIDNKGSPHYQEHDQANTVPNEPVQNSEILSERSIDVQTNIVPNEPEQHSEILSDKSIHVQVLHDVRNKPENCTFLNVQEYFNDTEHQDSPTPKLDDQILRNVENEPENATRIRTPINYLISPINTEESDADLSDGDPTFQVESFLYLSFSSYTCSYD